jgi:hypothetical protein
LRDDFSRFMTDLDITNGAGSLVTDVIPNPKRPPLPGQVIDADRESESRHVIPIPGHRRFADYRLSLFQGPTIPCVAADRMFPITPLSCACEVAADVVGASLVGYCLVF